MAWVRLLPGVAFDDEHAALRRAVPDRLDGAVFGRIFPGFGFFDAFKADHHEALGCVALDRIELASANDVLAAVLLDGAGRLRGIFCERGWIGHIHFRDHVSGHHFHLPRVKRRRARNAERRAQKRTQQNLVIRLHKSSPLFLRAWHKTQQDYVRTLYTQPRKRQEFGRTGFQSVGFQKYLSRLRFGSGFVPGEMFRPSSVMETDRLEVCPIRLNPAARSWRFFPGALRRPTPSPAWLSCRCRCGGCSRSPWAACTR